jgi:hypothetical protein
MPEERHLPDNHLQHLAEANRVFADQIKIADQKAAYIFTFLLALMVWSAETRKAFSWHRLQEAGPVVTLTSLLLATAIIIALFTAICVVLPRSRAGRTVLFWGAWPEAGDRLVIARRAGDEDFLFQDLLVNTRTLAAIAAAKYRMVYVAFRALLVTVAAYALQLIVAG